MGVNGAAFGPALRRARLAAGLTQEELAEQAGISGRTVSDLERGVKQRPRRDTLNLLLVALPPDARAALLAAARPPAGAPALVTQRLTNLPALLSSFVGREAEVVELRTRLPATRLLTLTGAGGVGKTRLALAVASAAQDDFPDGLWLVELAALADPALVPQALAHVLGVREQHGLQLTDILVAWLARKHLLLVLDNCEHLLNASAALVETLLHAAPGVHVLATSRERLRLTGELAWRVPSLAMPEPGPAVVLEHLARHDAVRLFVERARVVAPSFVLTNHNAPVVAQICRRLDGIPLAIELAAARLTLLTVEQVAARLDDRFHLLTGGSRTALPRQQTLRAAMDWSDHLLSEGERILFRRLAVFAGGWTLDAAETVCAGDGRALPILDGLARLVDKSLVQVDEQNGEARYRLLETVRQYAVERLQAAGEMVHQHARHLQWSLDLAERAEPGLWTADHLRWLARLDAEHDNLRAALAWSLDHDPPTGLRLAGGLWQYWRVRARFTEGQYWLDELLTRAPAPSVWRVKALLGTGSLAREQGDFVATRAKLEEGLALGRALGEARYTAWVLRHLGGVLYRLGERERARAVLEEGHVLIQTVPDQHGFGSSLFRLGELAELEGDYPQARRLYGESLAVARRAGERWLITGPLRHLAGVTLMTGDPAQARALAEEGLAVAQELGSPRALAEFHELLGAIDYWQGDLAHADTRYEASLTLARRHEDRAQIARVLARLGDVALQRGDTTRAMDCLTESLALRQNAGDRAGVAACQTALGRLAVAEGNLVQAATLLETSLATRHDLGERLGAAESLEALALVAIGQDDAERAAHLLGEADALRVALDTPLPPVDRPVYKAVMRVVRATLGETALKRAWGRGWRHGLPPARVSR